MKFAPIEVAAQLEVEAPMRRPAASTEPSTCFRGTNLFAKEVHIEMGGVRNDFFRYFIAASGGMMTIRHGSVAGARKK
jgi:hypothetical protein